MVRYNKNGIYGQLKLSRSLRLFISAIGLCSLAGFFFSSPSFHFIAFNFVAIVNRISIEIGIKLIELLQFTLQNLFCNQAISTDFIGCFRLFVLMLFFLAFVRHSKIVCALAK